MSDAAKTDWVQRVLGVSAGSGATAKAAPNPKAARQAAAKCIEIWRDAKDAADVGLSKLQSALKSSDDPLMQRIAEYGLHGVSRGLQVGIRVSLEEFARQPDPAAGKAQKLSKSVADFRRFIETDPAILLCDENPFGVDVALRSTFGRALSELDQQLRAVAG